MKNKQEYLMELLEQTVVWNLAGWITKEQYSKLRKRIVSKLYCIKNPNKRKESYDKYNQAHKAQHKRRMDSWNKVHKDYKKFHHLQTFCRESIESIENYELAKADNFKGWHCHHRLELVETGGQRYTSKKELIAKDMYFNRPASELIFMRSSEHNSIHSSAYQSWRKYNTI